MTAPGGEDVIWIPVLPSFKNFGAELGKGAAGVGRKTGEQIGGDIASGIESQKSKVAKAVESVTKSQDKAADAAGKLRAEEAKLIELRESGKAKSSQIVAAEERVESARRKSAAAVRDVETASRSHIRAQDDLTSAMDRSSESGKRSAISWGNIGRSVAGLAVGIGGAAVGIGAGLMSVAMTFDDVSDTIRAGTGQSGAALDSLVQSAKNVGTQVPAEFDKIGPTITALNQRLGLTGPVLETVASQLLEVGNMTGIEVDVNQLGGAFNAFGISAADSAATLDTLWQVSQNTGVGINELLASAQKGAPALKQFGFGMGESAALVGTLDKAGLDADKSLAAMNKALVQFAKDGKDPQQALYGTVTQIDELIKSGNEAGAIDLSAKLFGTKGAAQFVDAVKAGTFSVDDFVNATGGSQDTILGAGAATHDLAEQWLMFKNQALVAIEPIATRLFGILTQGMTWLRDVGAPAIGEVAGKVGDFIANFAASEGFQNFITLVTTQAWPAIQNLAAIMVDVGQRVLPILWAAFEPVLQMIGDIVGVVSAVVGWFTQHRDIAIVLGAALAGLLLPPLVTLAATWVLNTAAMVAYNTIGLVVTTATKLWAAAQWLLNAALTANPIGIVIAAIAALVTGIILAYQHSETFRNIVQSAWEAIQTAISFAWNSIIKPVFDALSAAVGFVIDHWKIFAGVLVAITGPVGIAVGAIVLVVKNFDTLKETVGAVASWIGDRVEDIVGFITGMPGRISAVAVGMWDGIKEAFRTVINWIIEGWNGIEFKIPGFDMGPVHFGGFTLGLPDIPMLAVGGAVRGPGTGTSDSILAALSNGEFVEPAKSVTSATLPWLEAIRSGWVPPAALLHDMVPGFAGGGLVSVDDLTEFARGVEGAPYVWGGVHWGDCSGAVSAIANFATGRDAFGSRFATGSEDSELAARGFSPGLGPDGSLSIGWYNGGEYGGHTAATLPNGVNFEMGGDRGDGQYGGQAAGAGDSMFTDHAHLPPEFFLGGDKIPNVNIPATTVGTDTLPASAKGSTTTSGTSTSAGSTTKSMTLSDLAGTTASNAAKGFTKDTLDFFGLGALADLPIVPQSQVSSQLGETAPASTADTTTTPGAAGSDGAPLIQVNNPILVDLDEFVRLLQREANHLVRSDAVGGIGGWS